MILLFYGLLIGAHWLVLAVRDARDGVELPFRWLNWLVVTRERRWLLLIIDAMLWFIFQAGAAGVVIPFYYFARYNSLVEIVRTVFMLIVLAHLGLAAYAEIHDRTGVRKRKNDEAAQMPSLLPDDGELVDFPSIEDAQPKQQVRRD